MIGVGQALSVPIVDPSRYRTRLMGAVGTRKGMSSTYHRFFSDLDDTHLLACQWPKWREISVELTILFHFFSHFLPLVLKTFPFPYLYSPRLLESGGHRKGMANEVRGSKHTDTF